MDLEAPSNGSSLWREPLLLIHLDVPSSLHKVDMNNTTTSNYTLEDVPKDIQSKRRITVILIMSTLDLLTLLIIVTFFIWYKRFVSREQEELGLGPPPDDQAPLDQFDTYGGTTGGTTGGTSGGALGGAPAGHDPMDSSKTADSSRAVDSSMSEDGGSP
ncbi:unnamed protein product [Nippostrongylus brasiliensis]|uniref:NRXN1 n=1 Tax=Nippostrongylus brasiliensis TaxID=27835 RepID=A0A0N4YKS6_NIPBR|nr:unnamed protein product [Nippostrongylus brasiliensis]